MDRRRFLSGAALAPVILGTSRLRANRPMMGSVFQHGVASGDPLPDSIVLWTHLTVGQGSGAVEVAWELASDKALSTIVKCGTAAADPDRDYCVKVDVDGLAPDRFYFYRFRVGQYVSPVGRTRTAPIGRVESLAFGVASCSNYPAGFFRAYRDMAQQDDLNAVIHLGDYIYEYGRDGYASHAAEALGRQSVPAHELISLADYRARHAQYKSDPDLQALHARHPMIAVWDDHEVANDAWRDGAENHDESEGSWAARKAAGWRAYEEWMPVRGSGLGRQQDLYRRFDFGDLASLIMLDTRFAGRARQIDPMNYQDSREGLEQALGESERQLLGVEQERWLESQLRELGGRSRWQLIGQQVMVSPLMLPDLGEVLDVETTRQRLGAETVEAIMAQGGTGLPLLFDTWDGYPAARDRFIQMLDTHAASAVVLTGDIHTSIASDLPDGRSGGPAGVELITTAISSPGFDSYLVTQERGQLESAFRRDNPHLAYFETGPRGWLRVDLSAERCVSTWRHVRSVQRRDGGGVFDGQRMSTTHRGDSGAPFGLRQSLA